MLQHTPSTEQIDAWLPQTQCTQCGYPRCRAYAEAIACGTADIDRCPPGGEVTLRALAELLRAAPKPLNPEYGEHGSRQRAVIDETLCIGCRKCLDVCPVDAIVGAHKYMHTVIDRNCTGCELCLPPCPVNCILMMSATPTNRSEPWPEYARTETEDWRARTERRLQRLANRKPKRVRESSAIAAVSPEVNQAMSRERIRADIRAAVARVKTKKQNRRDC